MEIWDSAWRVKTVRIVIQAAKILRKKFELICLTALFRTIVQTQGSALQEVYKGLKESKIGPQDSLDGP